MQKEETEQVTLFAWADYAKYIYPELEMMYHVPNEGKRSPRTGARLKQMGLKSGVPDVVLPVAHGGYFGLYIEMKYGRNTTTANQKEWLKKLKDAGHLTMICYSFEEAKEQIENYLKMPKTKTGGEDNG